MVGGGEFISLHTKQGENTLKKGIRGTSNYEIKELMTPKNINHKKVFLQFRL